MILAHLVDKEKRFNPSAFKAKQQKGKQPTIPSYVARRERTTVISVLFVTCFFVLQMGSMCHTTALNYLFNPEFLPQHGISGAKTDCYTPPPPLPSSPHCILKHNKHTEQPRHTTDSAGSQQPNPQLFPVGFRRPGFKSTGPYQPDGGRPRLQRQQRRRQPSQMLLSPNMQTVAPPPGGGKSPERDNSSSPPSSSFSLTVDALLLEFRSRHHDTATRRVHTHTHTDMAD